MSRDESTFPDVPQFRFVTELNADERRIIYRAVRLADERAVIIKSTASAWPLASEVERYHNEFRVLTHLQGCPQVATVLDFQEVERRPILVFADRGGTILSASLHGAMAPMEIDCGLRIGIAIADALAAIHDRNVIHKDIKPSNILVHEEHDEITLIDFGIASQLPVESVELRSPRFIEGTLPFISPEQTGRMNRGVDHRSDLYSFGVTLYRLLTGRLPFMAEDALGWCHNHLAQPPLDPCLVRPDLPRTVGAILLRLLAKAAEDRYQSASGCAHDLRRALSSWNARRAVEEFELGQSDSVHWLHTPGKLYGRERESEALLRAFRETEDDGATRVVLLAGYPGIGKTALVDQLHRPLLAARGRFISGKFEERDGVTPYAAVSQAFNALIRHLVAEEEATLAAWRERISAALGRNGQVLVDVLPAVQQLIGPQPEVPQLGPVESKNRFRMVFGNFVRAVAQPEQPLVLFLDDMQWADTASLELLDGLLSDSTVKHLFSIQAYRSNEVDATHRFQRFVNKLRAAGVRPLEIEIGPLDEDELGALVASVLRADTDSDEMRALTRIVADKTGGNPFFVLQFLRRLYDDGHLRWDTSASRMHCDVHAVAQRDYTDNVVESVVERMRALGPETSAVLGLAACMGDRPRLAELAAVTNETAHANAATLWPAVIAGLLTPLGHSPSRWAAARAGEMPASAGEFITPPESAAYRFPHDRIRQAAYSLLDADERMRAHLCIGRVRRDLAGDGLLQATDHRQLFDVVGQLERSIALMHDPGERRQLAGLAFLAARKTQASTAYAAAAHYLSLAADLLPEDAWESDADFTAQVYAAWAESSYLNGDGETADRLFQVLGAKARDDLERGRVLLTRARLGYASAEYMAGYEHISQALALFGLTPPRGEALVTASTERFATVARELEERSIPALAEEPENHDPEHCLILEIHAQALMLAALVEPEVLTWYILAGTLRSLRYGRAPWTEYFYIQYACISVDRLQSASQAMELAELALHLCETSSKSSSYGWLLVNHAAVVMPRNAPIAECVTQGERAVARCVEDGDLTYGGLGSFFVAWQYMERGDDLADVLRQTAAYSELGPFADNPIVVRFIAMQRRMIACMDGRAESLTCLDGGGFSEEEHLAAMTAINMQSAIAWYRIIKQILHYHAGEWRASWRASQAVTPIIQSVGNSHQSMSYHLFRGLAGAALYLSLAAHPEADPDGDERAVIRGALAVSQRYWRYLADACPDNYAATSLALDAEIARVDGHGLQAARLCERAVTAARAQGHPGYHALVSTVAARCFAALEFDAVATSYVRAAMASWRRWGANAIADHMSATYDQGMNATRSPDESAFADMDSGTTSSSSSSSSSSDLDAVTMLEAAEALSSELHLDGLIQRLLTIGMENAGADHGSLVLEHDAGMSIYSSDGRSYERGDEGALAAFVPAALVRRVRRDRAPILCGDALHTAPYASDPYVVENRVRSLLVLPIAYRGQLRAVLCLENRVLADVFTQERATVLELLSTQAAVALENARLYGQLEEHNRTLEERVTERTAALHAAKDAAEDANRAKSRFVAYVSHEIRTPMNAILAAVTTLAADALNREQAGLVALIRRGGEELLALLNELLDLSRIEAGKMELEDEPFDVRACLHDAVELMIFAAREKDVALVCQVDDDVPSLLRGDASRVRQVLLNTIGNAIKFTERGSVEVFASRAGDTLRLAVRDTGVGIPEDKLDRIFTVFSQADAATTRRFGGSGLGLTITRDLVELMHGTIKVESELGRGSTFIIELPLRQASLASGDERGDERGAHEAGDADDTGRGPPAGAKLELSDLPTAPASVRVLLADDNIINQKLSQVMLARLGYTTVTVVSDGREAIEAVRAGHIDVVLMDVYMPEVDGLEATRAIRADASIVTQPYIIALTGAVTEPEVAECAVAGMDDYLGKPVVLGSLQVALARAVRALANRN